MPSKSSPEKSRVKPPALQPGDTVGIVAPASNIQRGLLEKGCEELRRLGYRPYYKESIFDRDLYFAGSIERRARELEEMFERDEVRAVLCARGGYGCNYLLGDVNLDKIAANPKIFVGCSDVTTLLTWFSDAAGLVTFHGPMVTKDFARRDGVDLASWEALSNPEAACAPASPAHALVNGAAEGVLYGGCLSLLVASLGTPYEIRTEGTILFLEDVNAKPYQIDRMLMQLKMAGKLEVVRGLIFGEMLDCRQSPEQDYTLAEVIRRVTGDLGVPVAFGFGSGHVSGANITLPMGLNASLTVADNATPAVRLAYEAPVSAAPSRARATRS